MSSEIKLTSEEFGLLSLFQTVSGVTALDCVVDEEMDRIIFVVEKEKMGLAIGKNGMVIKHVEKLVGRPVEVVEYSEDPKVFLKNCLDPRYVREVRAVDKGGGGKVLIALVDARKKGAVLGRRGKNAKRARLLLKRHFGISDVKIMST